MEQLLTANVATNLYWLGRYLERIEETLHQVIKAYDKIIDVDKDAGVKLYKKFDIDLNYTGALDFLNEAILGDHMANLSTLIANARENAIISRNQINAEAFGEIIALNALFQNISKRHMDMDYKFIDNAQSLISEIWGQISKREHRKSSDYFLRLGKLVEEADFHFRFDKDNRLAMIIVDEIDAIVALFSQEEEKKEYSETSQQQSASHQDIMSAIHKKIESIIVE
jgi:uncharacterized alpha-E superfamily protein